MTKYYLHELDDRQFEEIVAEICIRILGVGFVNFADGIDGGRDGVFRGTANLYPSEAVKASGTTIVQAKHTTNPTLHCGVTAFKDTIIDEEIVRLKKIHATEKTDNYIIFTNRKLSGVTEPEIVNKIKQGTGINTVSLFGIERISLFLDQYQEIANKFGLNNFRMPLSFTYQDISFLVNQLSAIWRNVVTNGTAKYDLNYVEIDKKNTINGLSKDYFDYIKENSEQYFFKINNFLSEPANVNFSDIYFTLADELKGKLIANQAKFPVFDNVLEGIIQLSLNNNSQLNTGSIKRILRVFVHFMYCNCDIGKKQ